MRAVFHIFVQPNSWTVNVYYLHHIIRIKSDMLTIPLTFYVIMYIYQLYLWLFILMSLDTKYLTSVSDNNIIIFHAQCWYKNIFFCSQCAVETLGYFVCLVLENKFIEQEVVDRPAPSPTTLQQLQQTLGRTQAEVASPARKVGCQTCDAWPLKQTTYYSHSI